MDKLKRVLPLIVLLVDLATAANVVALYRMFEEPLFAVLIAIAFVVLQIGTLVLFSSPLPPLTRQLLFVATFILLSVNGAANVVLGFIRSEEAFPAEDLLPAMGFGGDAMSLRVVFSYITGLALLAATSIFWLALGQHGRLEEARARELDSQLDEILRGRAES